MQPRRVLITGASAGIGAALARWYAARGAHLVLIARRLDRLEGLEASLARFGGKYLSYEADVGRESDLATVVPQAVQALGGLDTVVANAGFGVSGAFEKLTVADYQRQFETNVFGVLRTLYATLEPLKRSQGRFAVVGSVNGYLALPNNSTYAMSKFAVRALCESLRYELAPHGVSVTHISPGFIATEIRQVDNQGRFHAHAKDPIPQWLCASAESAAHTIGKAIEKRVPERAVTFHGWFLIRFVRFFPRTFRFLVRALSVAARPEPH